MKKIINGKRYDTEAAKKLASISNIDDIRDFYYWEETLYQKRTGEYFIHGVGNAASKYAESAGQNAWCGGEKIIPLSIESAKEWAEKYLDGDDYEEIFGEVEEGSTEKRNLVLSLPEGVIEKIRRESAKEGLTMSEYVTALLSK